MCSIKRNLKRDPSFKYSATHPGWKKDQIIFRVSAAVTLIQIKHTIQRIKLLSIRLYRDQHQRILYDQIIDQD